MLNDIPMSSSVTYGSLSFEFSLCNYTVKCYYASCSVHYTLVHLTIFIPYIYSKANENPKKIIKLIIKTHKQKPFQKFEYLHVHAAFCSLFRCFVFNWLEL